MATLTKGNRKIKQRPLQVRTIASDFSIKMLADDGDDMAIDRTDFMTSISALLGTGATGTGGIIDGGDRMIGTGTYIDMGERV